MQMLHMWYLMWLCWVWVDAHLNPYGRFGWILSGSGMGSSRKFPIPGRKGLVFCCVMLKTQFCFPSELNSSHFSHFSLQKGVILVLTYQRLGFKRSSMQWNEVSCTKQVFSFRLVRGSDQRILVNFNRNFPDSVYPNTWSLSLETVKPLQYPGFVYPIPLQTIGERSCVRFWLAEPWDFWSLAQAATQIRGANSSLAIAFLIVQQKKTSGISDERPDFCRH